MIVFTFYQNCFNNKDYLAVWASVVRPGAIQPKKKKKKLITKDTIHIKNDSCNFNALYTQYD